MKKSLLLIATLMLASINILQSQNKYFERKYWVQDISDARKIFPKSDGTYVVIGNTMSFPDLIGVPFYLHINKYGDTLALKQHIFGNKNTTIWDAIETQYGYALAICQPQTETDTGCRANLMRLTHNGDLISLTLAGNDTIYQSWGRAILQTSDNGYIMAGLIIPGTGITNKLYTVKLKADGGTEWEKVYDYFPYHNSFRGILPAPEGGYYAIASIRRWAEYTSTFPAVLQYIGDILLYKLDDWGNVEWQKIYFEGGQGEQSHTFCQAPDGSLFIGGSRDFTDLLVKLDTEFNVAWDLQEEDSGCGPSLVTITPDNNFLISGCTTISPNAANAYLKKISPSGTVKWKRVYGDAGHDYFYTHHILPDGSIIVGGRNDMSSTAAVYIVKTNCMGLLTEPQAAFSYEAQGGFNNLVQFTNLSQYVYADSIDGGRYIWDWGDGSIPSVFGAEAFSQVNHYYPAPGIYPVTLYAIVCQDTSMVQALVDTQGGSGTVGIAQTPHQVEENAVRVYPNPAQNLLHFTLTGTPPLGGWSVSLFTPAGQRVLHSSASPAVSLVGTQATAAAMASHRIDVGHLPVGVYFYAVTAGGTVVARGKVAVVR